MEKKMTNIILCGGSGTRLWPKQFVKLFSYGGKKLKSQILLTNLSELVETQLLLLHKEELVLDQR